MPERRFGRTRAFAALIAASAAIPGWYGSVPGSPSARDIERHFFARIAAGFGVQIETDGSISHHPGTLFVMNHVSWVDIAVMLSLIDADFVAKAELASWPLIGSLARRFAPVFVERGARSDVATQAEAIRGRLQAGRSVILCPEGTTSVGDGLLPFRTSLFAATDQARAVQPLLISYAEPDGAPLSTSRQREVAWIDDDELLTGAARVARRQTLAKLNFLPLIPSGPRKQVAEAARAAMQEAYAALPKRSR